MFGVRHSVAASSDMSKNLSERNNGTGQKKRSVSKFFTSLRRNASVKEVDNESDAWKCVRRKPEGLQHLCQTTRFSKKEIQLMYRGFKQACPTGVVSQEKFKEIYSQLFPQGDVSQYATYVFETFDQDCNGIISFEEFVIGLSIVSRGSFEEKIRWIFALYDVDHDGILSRNDVEKVVQSVYDMMGKFTNPPVTSQTIDFHVNDILSECPMNSQTANRLKESVGAERGTSYSDDFTPFGVDANDNAELNEETRNSSRVSFNSDGCTAEEKQDGFDLLSPTSESNEEAPKATATNGPQNERLSGVKSDSLREMPGSKLKTTEENMDKKLADVGFEPSQHRSVSVEELRNGTIAPDSEMVEEDGAGEVTQGERRVSM